MQIYMNSYLMIRNIYHILLCLIFISFKNTFAQSDSIRFKNELGTNIGPVAMVALGSNQIFSQPLEVVYRRHIKNKLYFKSYFQHKKQFPLNQQGDILQYVEIIDTSHLNFHFSTVERWSRAMAFGFEYRINHNNWGLIYGVSLKYVYYKNQESNYYKTYKYNYGASQNPYLFGDNFVETINKKGNLVVDKTVGLEPNFGLYFNLGKRFMFTAQSRIYMGYGTQKYFHQDYITWYSTSRIFRIYRFDTDPIISEFSINYRF